MIERRRSLLINLTLAEIYTLTTRCGCVTWFVPSMRIAEPCIYCGSPASFDYCSASCAALAMRDNEEDR